MSASLEWEKHSPETLAWSSGTALNVATTGLTNGTKTDPCDAIDNETDPYTHADFYFESGSFGSGPNQDSLLEVYCLPRVDGTNYPDGGNSVVPPISTYVGGFPHRNSTGVQKTILPDVKIPPHLLKFMFKDSLGVSLATTGNTVKIVRKRYKSV